MSNIAYHGSVLASATRRQPDMRIPLPHSITTILKKSGRRPLF